MLLILLKYRALVLFFLTALKIRQQNQKRISVFLSQFLIKFHFFSFIESLDVLGVDDDVRTEPFLGVSIPFLGDPSLGDLSRSA